MSTAQIGSVVEPVSKWDPRKHAAGEFTYIDLSAIDQQQKLISRLAIVPSSEAPSRARQLVATGDVLVSTVRPNLNAVAQVPPSLDGATASTGFSVLRPSEGQLDGRYLFHWIQSGRFIDEMVRLATGASYPAVSDKIVKASYLPLPPIEEQRRIAAVLDAADALRAKRRQAIAKLDSLTQAIFIDMFGDAYDGSGTWSALSDLVRSGDKINYGVVQPGDHVEDGVPLVRVGDLLSGRVEHRAIKRISPDIDAKYGRSRLDGDEVLISCVGSTGAVALASAQEAGWNIARAVARVPLSSEALREYVAMFLSGPFVQRYFENELRTVSQPTLNIKQIKATPILVPPIELQEEFVVRNRAVDAARLAHSAAQAASDTLFASLQQRSFRGEL